MDGDGDVSFEVEAFEAHTNIGLKMLMNEFYQTAVHDGYPKIEVWSDVRLRRMSRSSLRFHVSLEEWIAGCLRASWNEVCDSSRSSLA